MGKSSNILASTSPFTNISRLTLLYHKPAGEAPGIQNNPTFPPTFQFRRPPFLNLVPLVKDVSGLTVYSQDHELFKRSVRDPLSGLEGEAITMMRSKIKDSLKPFLSAPIFEKLSDRKGRVTIYDYRPDNIEGMLLALRHEPISMKRVQMGEITLDSLKPGQWRLMSSDEVNKVCAKYYLPKSRKRSEETNMRFELSKALKQYNKIIDPEGILREEEEEEQEESSDEEDADEKRVLERIK